MSNKFKKFLVMPIVVPTVPKTLFIPGMKTLYQQQQPLKGVLKWETPEWNEDEYKKVMEKVYDITAEGISIEEYVINVAETFLSILPDRDFTVSIASFIAEYKSQENKESK